MAAGLVAGEGFAIDASIIKADASPACEVPGTEPIDWGRANGQSRAVREYIGAPGQANPVATDANEPAAPSIPPEKISLTDPTARWTAAPGGPAFFAYSTNYLIDLQAGIIVDVEATSATRSQQVDSTRTIIDGIQHQRNLKPRRLVGDAAYGTAALPGRMVEEEHIEPHVSVWDKTTGEDETFSRSGFIWNEHSNQY